MIFRIRIADVVIEVDSIYNMVGYDCYDYFAPNATPEIFITITQKDIDLERFLYIKQKSHENALIDMKEDCNLECMAVYRKICEELLNYDVFLMHGSAVAKDNKAFLFVAPSGTGKTTHSNLWIENIKDSFILNGDKPLLKVDGDNIIAYGTPWCGKERINTNKKIPIKAIFLLERGINNQVNEISFSDAFTTLYQQVYKPSQYDLSIKTLDLLEKCNNGIKYYRLSCNMDKSAAIIAYECVKSL